MGIIDHLLCLTLNTNDSLKQFLGQIYPKIQLKCLHNIEDLGNVFLEF